MKIPVGRTIEGAYSFAFSNVLNIAGIAWFPFLAFFAVIVALGVAMAASLGLNTTGDQADLGKMGAVVGFVFLVVLFAIVALAMVKVGILRQALGQHPGGVYFYFSLGARVWKLIGAYLLVVIVMSILVMALVALCAIIFAAVKDNPQAGLVKAVTVIVAGCAYIYSFVRLAFLLPAVVVAEDRIGLGRSWSLAGGSFWRTVVIWIAVVLPLAIVSSILTNVLLGVHIPPYHPGMTPQEMVQGYIATARSGGIVGLVINLVYTILSAGLTSGAEATAYLAVAGESEPGGSV